MKSRKRLTAKENHRRRRFWGIVVVALVLLLAGCTGALDDDADDPGEGVEYVPEDTDALVEVDLQVVFSDEVEDLLDGMNDLWMDNFGEPFLEEDRSELLEEFETETGLDYAEAESILMFGEEPDDPSLDDEFAFILQSGWDHADIADSVAENEQYDLELTEYAGEEVLYQPTDPSASEQPLYIGVLPDDSVVMGEESTVKDSLDVAYDDAPSISGPVLDLLESAPSGGIAMSFDAAEFIDDGELPDEVPDDEFIPPEFELESLEDVQAFGMAIYPDDGSIGSQILIDAGNADAADDFVAVLEGAISMWSGEIDEPEFSDQLDAIEVDSDDEMVTVTYEISIDELLELTEEFIWMFFGIGGGFDSVSTGAPGSVSVTGTVAG